MPQVKHVESRLSSVLNSKLLALGLGLMLAMKVTLATVPTMWMALLFWFLAGAVLVAWTRFLRQRSMPLHGVVLIGTGTASNGLVMLANGGVMPVFNLPPGAEDSAWRSAQSGDHLLMLADRLPFSTSLGDILILSGILAFLAVSLLRGANRFFVKRDHLSAAEIEANPSESGSHSM